MISERRKHLCTCNSV